MSSSSPSYRPFPSAEHAARAVLTLVVQPADAAAQSLLNRHGAAHLVERIDAVAHRGVADPDPVIVAAAWRWTETVRSGAPAAARQVIERLLQEGVRFVIPGDDAWPRRLNDLDIPPYGLWVKGNPARMDELLRRPALGIVGSREATPDALDLAHRCATALTGTRWTVWSGLARGVDGAAHQGCLSAGVPTIAVLPCGIDQVYPRRHASLAWQITSQGGLLVSEAGPTRRPSTRLFVARNRIIAAGDTTLVVQATSGTMHTVRAAQAMNRALLAVPAEAVSPASFACRLLIERGQATAVNGPEQLARALHGIR